MNYLPSNLKYLRKVKAMTQQDLAEALQLNRPVIGAYEEGRAEPKMETLQKLSTLFQVPLENLWSKKLTEESLTKNLRDGFKDGLKDDLEENHFQKRPVKDLQILSITVDSHGEENIEWVPDKASAGYLNGFSDPEYMASLPKFQLPMLKGGTLRAFEIKGDSMLPLVSGTFIIGEFLENYSFIENGATYIVMTKNEGIVYKRIYKTAEKNTLNMVSDNPDYTPYPLFLEDILEIWKSRAFISTEFPSITPPNSIDKISDLLQELQKSMVDLKKS